MSFTDLPLVYDLLQSHTCETPKDSSPCTCTPAGTKSKSPIVDKKLRNWEEWMRRRKEMHEKLGQLLQRDAGSLVMNSAEELRGVKEEKLALEYTKIPEPDPQRGCPGFWKLPVGLKDQCGESSYFAVLSKEEKCEVPEIEHVGLPRSILEEKDVLPRTRNSQALWDKSSYVKNKTTELARKLEQIRPHKPSFEDLFIEGVSLRKPPKKQPVQITLPETVTVKNEEPLTELEKEPTVLSLSINDLHLAPHLNISGTRKVYVIFDYDTNSKKVATEHITIKNLGRATIRFYWKRSEKVQLFKDIIPDRSHEIYFYFNKNEDLIIPGQTIQFPIWFKTEEPGTYCEQWEFCTKPKVMPNNSGVIVVLHASATIGDMNKKMEAIRRQLNTNIRDRLIRESLAGIMSNIPYEKFKPTVYCYNKKEVFETINSKFDPLHRQPNYLYNREVVRELQKFYKKVRRSSDAKVWNYNINELRILTKAKQKKEENLKWLAEQEEAKKLYKERPKMPGLACEKNIFPSLDGANQEISKEEKTQSPKEDQIGKTEKLIVEKSLTEQLEMIISKLERPTDEKNLEQDKYAQAYHILCTYFTKIGQEFEDLKDRLGIIKQTKYPKFVKAHNPPLYYMPLRLVHERLQNVLQGSSLAPKVGTRGDKPADEVLQAIPMEDSKKRYRTYYNLPDTPPPEVEKAKKGKGGKGDKKGKKDKKDKANKGGKKGKDKKSDKKGKKDKSGEKPAAVGSDEEDDGYVVNESFDPYAEMELTTPAEAEEKNEGDETEIESNIGNLPPAVLRQYKYNLYIIMYNNLDKAISNIVDMIEMQPREHLLPHAVIKEFEEPKYNRRLIDLKSLIAEESVQQLKAKLVLYNYRKHSKKDWKTIEIQRQLKNVRSDSSLWSILRPFETKQKLPEEKPISYPIDHYDVTYQKVKMSQTMIDRDKGESEDKLKKQDEDKLEEDKSPLMVNMSTSTLEGGVLDPNWEYFKDVGTQKNYGEEQEPDDLEAYIERIVSEISAQNLVDIKLNKGTQKRSDEHVSNEEYFYDSESSDVDLDTTDLSINSEQSEEDSCACEGFGVCNLPVEEQCSCEGYGECHLPVEKPYSFNEEYEEHNLIEELYSGVGVDKISENKMQKEAEPYYEFIPLLKHSPKIADLYHCGKKCD